MNSQIRSKRYRIAIFVIAALTQNTARSEVFNSPEYGFRFSIPAGFLFQPDPNAKGQLKFVEIDKGTDAYPISIIFGSCGQELHSQKLDLSPLSDMKNMTVSHSSPRVWKDIQLPTLRREANMRVETPFVGYIAFFPLEGSAIELLVQGPKNREQEVTKVFDESIQSFVNMKPYIVKVEQVGPSRTFRIVTQVAIGGVFLYWMFLMSRPRRLTA